jgi:hypothetical protein
VRTAALACLAKLPHSALCLRAVDYLTQPQPQTDGTPVLSTVAEKRGLFGLLKHAAQLNIALPAVEHYDKAMEKKLARDGYDIKARASHVADAPPIGPKLALVLQWLEIAPLDVLCERMALGNAALFALAAAHESGDDLIEALAQSLQAQARAPAHVIEALLATEKVPAELAMALITPLPFEFKENYILKPSTRCGVSELCAVFTVGEGIGEGLSEWILNYLRTCKHDYYNRAWNTSDTVAFALRLDVDLAQAFLNEARSEQARNQPDTPSDKACYATYFWKPLFQAIELVAQYRRALPA